MPYVRKTKRRPSVSKRLKIASLACLGLAAALVLFGLYTMQQNRISQAAQEAATFTPAPVEVTKQAGKPVAAFLGDSYTQGAGTDHASKSFAALAARQLGWQYQAFAQGGTGYTGPDGESYGDRVDALIAAKPDVVVISGTRNDSGSSSATVQELASGLYGRIKAALPEASVVVVGPMWLTPDVPSGILTINSGIKAAAEAHDIPFIDAVNPSWMDGDPAVISEDGVHPTELGHERLAEQFVAAVDARGLGT